MNCDRHSGKSTGLDSARMRPLSNPEMHLSMIHWVRGDLLLWFVLNMKYKSNQRPYPRPSYNNLMYIRMAAANQREKTKSGPSEDKHIHTHIHTPTDLHSCIHVYCYSPSFCRDPGFHLPCRLLN